MPIDQSEKTVIDLKWNDRYHFALNWFDWLHLHLNSPTFSIMWVVCPQNSMLNTAQKWIKIVLRKRLKLLRRTQHHFFLGLIHSIRIFDTQFVNNNRIIWRICTSVILFFFAVTEFEMFHDINWHLFEIWNGTEFSYITYYYSMTVLNKFSNFSPIPNLRCNSQTEKP